METTRIRGVSRTSLWQAWKFIRKQLRHATARDVVDYLDYDVEPDVWIDRLLQQLAGGQYEPRRPRRFSLAKAGGFSRVMTMPMIPDLVLYRAVVDYCYARSKKREHRYVFFERAALSRVAAEAAKASGDAQGDPVPYTVAGRQRFLAWLRYDEYRRRLILKRVYPFIVVTDVTNYFDSIQYTRISEALSGIPNARLIGLLFFMLERLSIRHAYTECPRVGLPVDEFDCSRKLAHLVLFPHDDRMVTLVGHEAYVRWMDDQNIGVPSRAAGIRTLAAVGESLARLHLTANQQKSAVLSLAEARRHFHLDLNAALNWAEAIDTATSKARANLASRVREVWSKAKRYEGEGEWEKVLKRLYRLAGRARMRGLRRRAEQDIIDYPSLALRIADYMRCTGSAEEYLAFAERIWHREDQVYSDVSLALAEALLRLEAPKTCAVRIRRLASQWISELLIGSGFSESKSLSPLLILKYGDRRSLPRLSALIERQSDRLAPNVTRAAAVVFASYGRDEFTRVRRVAARLWSHELADMVRLLETIADWDEVPNRFANRINSTWDPVAGRNRVDIRSVLTARLLTLSRKPTVLDWVRARKASMKDGGLSAYDCSLLDRLVKV